MSDFQRRLFQKKLREAEAALGFDLNAGEEDQEQEDSLAPLPNIEDTRHRPETRTSDSTLPKWSEFFESNEIIIDEHGNKFNSYYTAPADNSAPIFVFHHGAGSSGLTFAPLARKLNEQMVAAELPKAAIFTFDARGHGATEIKSNPTDFSLKAFTDDFIYVLTYLLKSKTLSGKSLFVIGHSLGGSILTNATIQLKELDIRGLGMFDIVEDTAISALNGMETYLAKKPKEFVTVYDAIDWHLKSGLLKNKESALITVPPLLKRDDKTGAYKWIADLWKTSDYWHDWFIGLSKKFVEAYPSKLLILAGTDSLDKQLMIGQMQGKYQLIVFQNAGHFVHEDVPEKTALALIDFYRRNDKKQVVIKTNWGSAKK